MENKIDFTGRVCYNYVSELSVQRFMLSVLNKDTTQIDTGGIGDASKANYL